MWIKKKNKLGEESPVFKKEVWKYVIKGRLLILIMEYSSITLLRGYRGYVYYNTKEYDEYVLHRKKKVLHGDNLHVLKLKCLVAAKELGWDIKEISV